MGSYSKPDEVPEAVQLGALDALKAALEVRYIKAPPYKREKVNQLLLLVKTVAAYVDDHPEEKEATLKLSREDMIVLNDMLQEMDRHLPDFFEG